MSNTKTLQRLLKILRMGGSDQIHEADTAFSMVITLMEKHTITIENLLDQFQPKDIPQQVMAELARRYCLSRTDRGLSAREEYYRSTFLRIAEWYSPRPKTEEPTETPDRKPTTSTNQKSSSTTSSESQKQKPPNHESPKRYTNTGQRDSTGEQNRRQGSTKSTSTDNKDPADWKRKMDEARERENEARRREAESDQARRTAEEQARKLQEENERFRRERESEELRVRRSPRSGFFSDAFSNPLLTVRLFLVCCLYGLPRAVISLVLLAGGFQELGIHTFDSLNWVDALSIALFPFTVYKGIQLYRSGWYP